MWNFHTKQLQDDYRYKVKSGLTNLWTQNGDLDLKDESTAG